MKKFYTQEEMIAFINDIDVIVEDYDNEGICESIGIRLSTQNQHIEYLRERLQLAEKVIGELYLMQRETDDV